MFNRSVSRSRKSNKVQKGSAKFWVCDDGSTVIANKGHLKDKTIKGIQRYIANNYLEIYEDWIYKGGTPGFYNRKV